MYPVLDNSKSLRKFVQGFLECPMAHVLKLFAALPGAQVDDEWVYVPGSRKDRVLLVAHADTVNDDKKFPKVQWVNDIAIFDPLQRTTQALKALGGDDRAGCAMLYALAANDKVYGHSLLVTTGEESGCKGTRAMMTDAKVMAELREHQFAIEVDRHGLRNYVYYSVSTGAFESYVGSILPEWEKEHGSFTDIAALCPELEICGVNIAAGYIGEHFTGERLLLGAWYDSFEALSQWLQMADIPKFKLPRPKPAPPPPFYPAHAGGGITDAWWDRSPEREHRHQYINDLQCNAYVCKCGHHWKQEMATTSYYFWKNCDVCIKRAEAERARVIGWLDRIEAQATTGILSGPDHAALRYALEERSQYLTKGLRKRIRKVIDRHVRMCPSTVKRVTEGFSEKGSGACNFCGYRFQQINKVQTDKCPQCKRNPNEIPGYCVNNSNDFRCCLGCRERIGNLHKVDCASRVSTTGEYVKEKDVKLPNSDECSQCGQYAGEHLINCPQFGTARDDRLTRYAL